MARTSAEVVGDIRSFRPVNNNWLALDGLLAELWAAGEPAKYIRDLLAVFERFPEHDGFGVLWSVLHGLESLPGYERELVQSVQRHPSDMGVCMVGRMLNSGLTQIEGHSLVELLRTVAVSNGVPASIRVSAADWVSRHSGPRAT